MYLAPHLRLFRRRVSDPVDRFRYSTELTCTCSADTAASAGYLAVIGALSFVLWYRPIYLGFSRTEGKAMAFFFCR